MFTEKGLEATLLDLFNSADIDGTGVLTPFELITVRPTCACVHLCVSPRVQFIQDAMSLSLTPEQQQKMMSKVRASRHISHFESEPVSADRCKQRWQNHARRVCASVSATAHPHAARR